MKSNGHVYGINVLFDDPRVGSMTSLSSGHNTFHHQAIIIKKIEHQYKIQDTGCLFDQSRAQLGM